METRSYNTSRHEHSDQDILTPPTDCAMEWYSKMKAIRSAGVTVAQDHALRKPVWLVNRVAYHQRVTNRPISRMPNRHARLSPRVDRLGLVRDGLERLQSPKAALREQRSHGWPNMAAPRQAASGSNRIAPRTGQPSRRAAVGARHHRSPEPRPVARCCTPCSWTSGSRA